MSLKSLYPQIVENAARRKIEKRTKEEEVREEEEEEQEGVEVNEEEAELQHLQDSSDEESAKSPSRGGHQGGFGRDLHAFSVSNKGNSSSGKKSFKEVAKEEILRDDEPSLLDKMMAGNQTMAVGRRQLDADEIEEEEEEVLDEAQERKAKIRGRQAAVPPDVSDEKKLRIKYGE